MTESVNSQATDANTVTLGNNCYVLSLTFGKMRAFEKATGKGLFALFDRVSSGAPFLDDTITLFEVMAGLGTPDKNVRAWVDSASGIDSKAFISATLKLAYAETGTSYIEGTGSEPPADTGR